MTLYANQFMSIVNAATNETVVLRVTSFEEAEYSWRGAERQAFDGTLLSTLRAPRIRAKATVEFLSGTDLDSFQRVISAGIDPLTNNVTTPARCLLFGDTFGLQGAPRTRRVFSCFVHITSKRPWFYQELSKLETGWVAELDIREI